jgi:predicted nucleic acid-binding protein
MAVAGYLVDKSAVARLHLTQVAEVIMNLRTAGLLAICGMVELEILYSARNGADHGSQQEDLEASYERLYTEEDDFVRARAVQHELADLGRHRAVSLPDLLIAAVAERHRVSVLHYDADFELISEVTGQPSQWVVPRGSVG